MIEKFKVEFLADAVSFLNDIEPKAQEKIYYNIRKAQYSDDPVLFKKLGNGIWEFRTLYNKKYYRLFAFWDKLDKNKVLVIATHGVIKKTGKIRDIDLQKAERLMKNYFKN